MRFKKYIILAIISMVLMVSSISFFATQNKLDGSTIESREMRLDKLDKLNSNAHICSEINIDDYIVSGYITSNNKYGLAIFEPVGNGKYRFQGNYLTENDNVIFWNIIVNHKNYDLFWANKTNLKYAKITYSVFYKVQKPLKLDASENKIICNKSPSKSYSVKYVFVDADGNRFK